MRTVSLVRSATRSDRVRWRPRQGRVFAGPGGGLDPTGALLALDGGRESRCPGAVGAGAGCRANTRASRSMIMSSLGVSPSARGRVSSARASFPMRSSSISAARNEVVRALFRASSRRSPSASRASRKRARCLRPIRGRARSTPGARDAADRARVPPSEGGERLERSRRGASLRAARARGAAGASPSWECARYARESTARRAPSDPPPREGACASARAVVCAGSCSSTSLTR